MLVVHIGQQNPLKEPKSDLLDYKKLILTINISAKLKLAKKPFLWRLFSKLMYYRGIWRSSSDICGIVRLNIKTLPCCSPTNMSFEVIPRYPFCLVYATSISFFIKSLLKSHRFITRINVCTLIIISGGRFKTLKLFIAFEKSIYWRSLPYFLLIYHTRLWVV
jgi:hypothetical protein